MTIKAGIIGFGNAGRNFHAPFLKLAGISLSAIVTSQKDLQDTQYPNLKIYKNPDQLFADPTVDLIIITSPSFTHADLTLRAVKAGKHVVCDKPLCATVAEADKITAAVKSDGQVVSCFQNRRWDGNFLTVKQLLQNKTLGDLQEYHAFFNAYKADIKDRWQEEPGPAVGVEYDLGFHLIDQALYLFGMPSWLEGEILTNRKGGKVSDCFQLKLGYANFRAYLSANLQIPAYQPRYIIHGTTGSYEKSFMDVQEDQLKAGINPSNPVFGVEPPERWGVMTSYDKEKLQRQFIPTEDGKWFNYYQEIADAITLKKPQSVAIADARKTVSIINALQQASETAQRVYF